MSENETDELTIACTLTESEKKDREAFIRETFLDQTTDVTKLETGYRIAFRMGEETLDDVAKWVRLEADCCSFATFEITVPPEAKEFTVEMTGPEDFSDLVGDGVVDEFRDAAGA